MGDHGESDPSKDPWLAIHWGFVACLLAIATGLLIWTQYELELLFRRGIRVQTIDGTAQVTILELMALLWIIPPLINWGADLPFNCALHGLLSQFATSTIVSMQAYRTLRFALRLSQIEQFKYYIKRGMHGTNLGTKRVRTMTSKKIWNRVMAALRGPRIIVYSLVIFLACFLLFFTHYPNIETLQNNPPSPCALRTSTYVLVIWYLWALPIALLVRCAEISDPFMITTEIQVQLLMATVGIIIALPIGLSAEEQLGTSHWELLWSTLSSFFSCFHFGRQSRGCLCI
mmetsp:Transcript_3612/g.6983  ORF Transcript_3612/g.6983 Transcript_3612/m.6983 type:complete len:287 (-) Transcript_3612:31-891(-)